MRFFGIRLELPLSNLSDLSPRAGGMLLRRNAKEEDNTKRVESRGGAVVLGFACLLPPLSLGGA